MNQNKFNSMQENFDNQDNPDYQDEYQSIEEIALETEIDFQEGLIKEDTLDGQGYEAIMALSEYLIHKLEEGDDEEFYCDMKKIISSTLYDPWANRHNPLNRQIDKAIRFKAEQIAKKTLKCKIRKRQLNTDAIAQKELTQICMDSIRKKMGSIGGV